MADSQYPSSSTGSSDIEFIFLGTGTSSSLPHLDCITAPPDRPPCKTCLSSLTPEGKYNNRRNTSAAIRMKDRNGKTRTIVIDVGKNFQAAALEWFPKYGLRKIDALLITHAHADAMNGLDDLRVWTLHSAIQPHIDIYVSQETFREVQRSFPYLVSKEFASGGGDVPDFVWHIIQDGVPFEIKDTGIRIKPFSVHHGRLFSTAPLPGYLPTPSTTGHSTPAAKSGERSNSYEQGLSSPPKIHPYLCFGYVIQESVLYVSDVSFIPEETWRIIEHNGGKPIPLMVIDCLRLEVHTSHFGLKEAVDTARRLRPRRSYITGMSHDVSHDEYVSIGKTVGIGNILVDTLDMTSNEVEGLNMVRHGEAVWIRPAHDGLRVFISSDGAVRDTSYG